MSDEPLMPPPAAPAEPQPEPLRVAFNRDEVNYFLHTVDFYRELLSEFFKKADPLDVPILAAFIQSVIETQIPQAAEAFNEVRYFFDTVYPQILANHFEKHPEEAQKDMELTIVIPHPSPEVPALSPYGDGPRIITPNGTDWKN